MLREFKCCLKYYVDFLVVREHARDNEIETSGFLHKNLPLYIQDIHMRYSTQQTKTRKFYTHILYI